MAKRYFPTFRRIGSGIANLWRNPRLLGAPFVRMGRWALRVAPKVGFGLLVLFVLAAIPWTYFNIKYGRELEAELTRIKAAGEPLTIIEAAPKAVPDEQNAAVLYQKVFRMRFEPEPPEAQEQSDGLPAEVPVEEEPEPVLEQRGFRDIAERNAVYDYIMYGREERKARQVLDDPRVRQRLGILRQAVERPYSVFPVNWEDGPAALFPHLAEFRDSARFLAAKMLMAAADGDTDGALEWCCVSLRMSEHAASEPTLIAQLVGIAMQAIALKGAEQMLAEAAPSVGAADSMLRYVGAIDMKRSFLNAMRGERGFGRCVFEQARSRSAAQFAHWVEGGTGVHPLWYLYASPVGKPLRAFDELTYLKYWRLVLEVSGMDYREAKSGRLSEVDHEHDIPVTAPVAQVMVPIFARAGAKRDWAIARLDEFRIVLALKVYKQEHGPYPETLDELQRTLSWELPKDVFSGEAFRYQRKGEGFMLYSFGQDLDDDGGVREEDRKYEDGDIVWECAK